ncbi:hypothetical protein DYB32_008359 [Aphanomyces invadans]|uniref:Uncharacterized protein n=1 Tax=Aphanomyces invadans TaxID=157072 RepID=A0A418ALC1_9STRA|nr:hypothetical protein DYB32_008359 [Aphanomyces invadans]
MTHEKRSATVICVGGTTDKPRWGKWTKEEEAYTARLIADFTAGLLTDVDNGTTMRSWLSAKLRCCPMRISKKFVGEHSIGKRMFERNDARITDMTDRDKAHRAAELDVLHAAFCESWAREERERLEHQTNGTRKRKRNKQPKKTKPSVASSAANIVMTVKRPVSPLAFKHPCRTFVAPVHARPKAIVLQRELVQQSPLTQPSALTLAGTCDPQVHACTQAPTKAASSLPQAFMQPAPWIATPNDPAAKSTNATLLDLQQSLATRSRNLSVDLTGGDLFTKTATGGELDFTEFAMDVRDDSSHSLDLMDTTDAACWMPDPLDYELDDDPFVAFDAAAALMLPPQVQVAFSGVDRGKSSDGELMDLALSPTSVMDMEVGWPSLTMEYDGLLEHQY